MLGERLMSRRFGGRFGRLNDSSAIDDAAVETDTADGAVAVDERVLDDRVGNGGAREDDHTFEVRVHERRVAEDLDVVAKIAVRDTDISRYSLSKDCRRGRVS